MDLFFLWPSNWYRWPLIFYRQVRMLRETGAPPLPVLSLIISVLSLAITYSTYIFLLLWNLIRFHIFILTSSNYNVFFVYTYFLWTCCRLKIFLCILLFSSLFYSIFPPHFNQQVRIFTVSQYFFVSFFFRYSRVGVYACKSLCLPVSCPPICHFSA